MNYLLSLLVDNADVLEIQRDVIQKLLANSRVSMKYLNVTSTKRLFVIHEFLQHLVDVGIVEKSIDYYSLVRE